MTSPATPRRPDGAAFVIAGLLAGLGGLLIWDGARIPVKTGYAGVGSGDVPQVIGACLIGLALWTAIAGYRGVFEPRPRQHLPPLFWIIAGLSLQLILLNIAGFSVASGVLFACTAAAFGKRQLLTTLPIGIALAGLVYLVFDGLLRLNLPAGPPEQLLTPVVVALADGITGLFQPGGALHNLLSGG
jgi:putative tricarboxylic transport membrane protein